VLSDQIVVVVLTAAAHLVLPDYPLSATQTRPDGCCCAWPARTGLHIRVGCPLYKVDTGGSGTVLAALDMAGGRLVPVGRLTGSVPDDPCQAAHGYLACRVADRFVVWRYPAG
jgi:hypothetical protein